MGSPAAAEEGGEEVGDSKLTEIICQLKILRGWSSNGFTSGRSHKLPDITTGLLQGTSRELDLPKLSLVNIRNTSSMPMFCTNIETSGLILH